MQDIVGDRLPRFTKEEVKMVKGSMDFVGINQYTAYYMYDPHQPKPKVLGYQQDWNAGFACKLFPSSSENTYIPQSFLLDLY
jgi:beta-glucosidase